MTPIASKYSGIVTTTKMVLAASVLPVVAPRLFRGPYGSVQQRGVWLWTAKCSRNRAHINTRSSYPTPCLLRCDRKLSLPACSDLFIFKPSGTLTPKFQICSSTLAMNLRTLAIKLSVRSQCSLLYTGMLACVCMGQLMFNTPV